jgi:hypothetical protein
VLGSPSPLQRSRCAKSTRGQREENCRVGRSSTGSPAKGSSWTPLTTRSTREDPSTSP